MLFLAGPLAAMALRTIELVTTEGEVVMDSDTASCQACQLIVAHVNNQTKQDFVKVLLDRRSPSIPGCDVSFPAWTRWVSVTDSIRSMRGNISH